jgi:hypothetical protein
MNHLKYKLRDLKYKLRDVQFWFEDNWPDLLFALAIVIIVILFINDFIK